MASFKINQDYIAKNLCIEKDVEGSTCQGCCQLKKKMHEQEEQKRELPPQQTEKQNIDFCIQATELNDGLYPNSENLRIKNSSNYSFLKALKVFHPPKYCC
ncbi:hypothetical protein [Draconibacterium mangrovi]|uniref:hypothetical protein n=1 Tax=Draconibacterium mangrovi TaxID=2697469 RepID=UPI0013D11933|nr:hypothetical protein [Draconibacterium mangrovi]